MSLSLNLNYCLSNSIVFLNFTDDNVVFVILHQWIVSHTNRHHGILVDLSQESIASRFTFQMIELLFQLNPIEFVFVELGLHDFGRNIRRYWHHIPALCVNESWELGGEAELLDIAYERRLILLIVYYEKRFAIFTQIFWRK